MATSSKPLPVSSSCKNPASHQFQTGVFWGRLSVVTQLNYDTWKRPMPWALDKGPMRTPRVASFPPGTADPTIARVDPPLNPPGPWMRLSLPDEHRACVRACCVFFLCTCRCFRFCCSSRVVGLRFFSTDFLSYETFVLPEIF